MKRNIYSKNKVRQTTFSAVSKRQVKGTGVSTLSEKDKKAVEEFKDKVDRNMENVRSIEQLDIVYNRLKEDIRKYGMFKDAEYRRLIKSASLINYTYPKLPIPSSVTNAMAGLSALDTALEGALAAARMNDITSVAGIALPKADETPIDSVLRYVPTTSPYSVYAKTAYDMLGLEDPLSFMQSYLDEKRAEVEDRLNIV